MSESVTVPANEPMPVVSEPFRVYVNGLLYHTVPCGVCEARTADLADVNGRYDTALSDNTRESVRYHLEQLAALLHPDKRVMVR